MDARRSRNCRTAFTRLNSPFTRLRNLGQLDDLQHQTEVCVTMSGWGEFASLTGHATGVYDRAKFSEYWNDKWRIWFNKGESDQSLTLVRLTADRGEFWSAPQATRIKHFFPVRNAHVEAATPQEISG